MFFGTKEEIVLALTLLVSGVKNSKVPVTLWSVNFVETEWFRRLLNICKLPQSFSCHQVHLPEKFWEIFSLLMLSDTD